MEVESKPVPSAADQGKRFTERLRPPARSTVQGTRSAAEALRKTHAYWRACNYLSLGMIYYRTIPCSRNRQAGTYQEPALGHGERAPLVV